MSKVEIKFKKLAENAKLPEQNHKDPLTGDTGYDIFCTEETWVMAGRSAVVPTGIEVAFITPGYWFKIEARSGLGFKHSCQPHFGIIDNGYRGNLGVKIYNLSDADYSFQPGDRVAQLVIYKLIPAEVSWSDEKEESNRGAKGFGSSGN